MWGWISDRRLGRRGAVTLAARARRRRGPALHAGDEPHDDVARRGGDGRLCGIGIWGMAPTYLTERFPTIVRGVGPGPRVSHRRGDRIGDARPSSACCSSAGCRSARRWRLSSRLPALTVAAVIWFRPENAAGVFSSPD